LVLGCGSDDDSQGNPGGNDAGNDSTATGGTSGGGTGGTGGTSGTSGAGGGTGGTAGSGGNVGDAASDACVDCPTGSHFGYVVKEIKIPSSGSEATQFGLDLDGDGSADNQFGQFLVAMAGQGFDIQGSNNEAVQRGNILMLFDFQAPDFTTAAGAALTEKLGANPNPAACTNPNDLLTCGKHLLGTATFEIAPTSPTDRMVQGPIASGVFNGGPGKLFAQFALAGPTPIQLDLIGARIQAKNMSATGMDEVILAGGITQNELDTAVIPNMAAAFQAIVTQDCAGGPPSCGCTSSSQGSTVIQLFDANQDCNISVTELKTNPIFSSILSPDVKIDGVDALSFGVKVSTVIAKFPGIDP
jgi:hypothetical protein